MPHASIAGLLQRHTRGWDAAALILEALKESEAAATAGSRPVRSASTVSRRTNSGSEIQSYGKRSKEKDDEHKSPAACSGKEGKDGSPKEKRARVLANPEPSRKECDNHACVLNPRV